MTLYYKAMDGGTLAATDGGPLAAAAIGPLTATFERILKQTANNRFL